MSKKSDVSDLSAAELLQLAAEKMGVDASSLSGLELGLEGLARELTRLELTRRLNEEESSTAKKCPSCGARCRVRVRAKERTLRTLSGEVVYRRNYHYCDGCSRGFYPRDVSLDIPDHGDVSSELERRILDFAMNDPFEQGAKRFSLHYSRSASSNLLRRVFHRVSERLTNCNEEWIEQAMKEPEKDSGTIVVETDGSMISTNAGWKEIKLGMVYSLSSGPERSSKPSPRYVASMQGTLDFEEVLEQAIDSHLIRRPQQVVWLGDGAAGFWNIAQRVCPDAAQILDWYHAIEHASDCAKILFEGDEVVQELWTFAMKKKLAGPGGIQQVESELEACLFGATASEKAALNNLRRYYHAHRDRMKYRDYRSKGWPIGSGSIESAHRYVLQARMKRAGQHWSKDVASAMAKMRAHYITAGPHKFHQAIAKAAELTEFAA